RCGRDDTHDDRDVALQTQLQLVEIRFDVNRADRLSVQNNPTKNQQMAILEDGPIGRDRRYGKRRSAGARVYRERLASGVIDARVGDVRLDAKRIQDLLSLHLILER